MASEHPLLAIIYGHSMNSEKRSERMRAGAPWNADVDSCLSENLAIQ
jgi:hypothetical protein